MSTSTVKLGSNRRLAIPAKYRKALLEKRLAEGAVMRADAPHLPGLTLELIR